MKYGNYATFDCPLGKDKEQIEERIKICYDWLDDQLEKIPGCFVNKRINIYDSKSYPSFEIFMPAEYEYIHEDGDKFLINQANLCYKQLHKVEKDYYAKFSYWF